MEAKCLRHLQRQRVLEASSAGQTPCRGTEGLFRGSCCSPLAPGPSLGASAAPGPSPGQPTREEAGSRQLRSRELEACLPLPGA